MQTEEEVRKQSLLLQGVKNFESWQKLIKDVQHVHQRILTNQTRVLYRQTFKQCIQLFIEDLYTNKAFIQICFKYAYLFRDPTEIFKYFEGYRLGFGTSEYVCQMAQYVANVEKDREKALAILNGYRDQEDSRITFFRNKILVRAGMYFEESIQSSVSSKIIQKQLIEIQPDELRLSDMFKSEFSTYKQKLQLRQINPFTEMVENKLVVSQMVSFLTQKQLDIYYQNHDKHVSWMVPQQVPDTNQVVISYLEFADSVPTQLIVGDVLRFDTSFSANQLTVKKQLGVGGFAHMYKAELVHSSKVFSVSLKLFNREKDQIKFDKQAVSASYLRELYANAVLLQRIHQLKNIDLLDSVEVPFNKLLCGLIGKHGNGLLLLQYCQGDSLFNLIKNNIQFTKSQIKSYFSQMVESVKLLHQCDIVHCDIKIDNWMLEGQTVKLIDFGKAVDLQLFAVPDQHLTFVGNGLRAVSPSPSCRIQWCFEADYCGLAASLFGLVIGNVLCDRDIELQNGVGSLIKKYKLGVYEKMFNELLNFQATGNFLEQKRQDEILLGEILKEIETVE